MEIKFRINNDKFNDTHNSFTYFPYLIRTEMLSGLTSVTTFVEASEYLKNNAIRLTWNDISGEVKNNYNHNEKSQDYLSRTRFDYPAKGGKGRRNYLATFADKDNKDKVIFDDDTYVQNAVYEKSLTFYNIFTQVYNSYNIIAFRNYLNNSGDNLLKNIIAMYVSNPYKLSNIKFVSVPCYREDDESITGSTSSGLQEITSSFRAYMDTENEDETTGDTSNTVQRMVIELALSGETLTNASIAGAAITVNNKGDIAGETSVYQIYSDSSVTDENMVSLMCGIYIKITLNDDLNIKTVKDYPNDGLDLYIMGDNQFVYRINLFIDDDGNLST